MWWEGITQIGAMNDDNDMVEWNTTVTHSLIINSELPSNCPKRPSAYLIMGIFMLFFDNHYAYNYILPKPISMPSFIKLIITSVN